MCRKYVLASSLDKIETRFHVRINPYTLPIPESFAVSGTHLAYVITSENPHEILVYQFGMTPYWAKKPMNLINARAEGDKNANDDAYYNGPNSIFLKQAFKKPIQSQRCLVIADAFYEWSADKKPYLAYLQDKERPFAFAGIFDRWKDPDSGEGLTSFAIITTTANSLLQQIGVKRMPVILTKSNETKWIKSEQPLSYFLKRLLPFPSEMMNAYPVSELVNSPEINIKPMLNPIGEKLQTEEKPTFVRRSSWHHKEKTVRDTPWFQNRHQAPK